MRVSLTATVPSLCSSKLREQLSDAERLGARHDAELARMRPAPLARLQQLLGHRRTHELRHGREAARLLGRAARHARRAEEHRAARRLRREALEDAMDDEPAQAVADEVHLGERAAPDEGREALGGRPSCWRRRPSSGTSAA